MKSELARTPRKRQSLGMLLDRTGHGEEPSLDLHAAGPIDKTKWFICPTLTPMYYTAVYRELDETHQRRYNQLTALCFNELIAFFEEAFASAVLAALGPIADTAHRVEWKTCLEGFLEDERQHQRWWHELNRLSEPTMYAGDSRRVVRLSSASRRVLGWITSHPRWFPVVFWIMLALEERSLDISKRCLKLERDQIEPRYLLIYQRHLKDEFRHVQIDWHLIELFYAKQSKLVRNANAHLLAMLIGRFFLTPNQSAVRVVRHLVRDYEELAPLLPAMISQLTQLKETGAYHEMMYSRSTTPILFSLFDRFPEMRVMEGVLLSYRHKSDESKQHLSGLIRNNEQRDV